MSTKGLAVGSDYHPREEFLNALMADLYTEDVPFPAFNNDFRFFRLIGYLVLRAYLSVKKWVIATWGMIFPA